MSAAEIVADLSRLGIKLWVESDQLRFKAPQGVLTPELKTKLVEQKSDLLAFLRQVQSSAQSSAAPPISPAARQGDLPLSYAQERLWFVDQWEPGSAAYNIYDAILIEGKVELAALEKSLNEIVRRHEVLRTTFAVRDGQPSQRIAPEMTLTVPVVNLDDYTGADSDAELRRLINAETSCPFDLSCGPLMRVVIFRLEKERHVLLFNLHHIVSDGWTTGVLIKEMAALYDAFTRGRPSPLPELRIQYADFAAWQREWLKGDRLESEKAFWKAQLNGAPTSLELPTDRPRPHVRTSRGATHELALPPALSMAVRRLAQQERVTPYVVWLSAWTALLWKYTSQDEIVIGSPHANRNRTELEDLIGFFVNTL
ncbi:MAG TPA: condensation domain-containing protein, partial [Blastocatellia bacterium]|nr:condensation domain-containing protein [Blastocatellia bacterium]